VEFEWDPEKAESNFQKHRIRFFEAASVFIDDALVTVFDESTQEDRYIGIGRDYMGRVLFVVYTARGERIRLISARKAKANEFRQYEKRR
jgi:uncharacterized DUF497 family protein